MTDGHVRTESCSLSIFYFILLMRLFYCFLTYESIAHTLLISSGSLKKKKAISNETELLTGWMLSLCLSGNNQN